MISEVPKIGAMKPIFLDSGSPRGEGGFMRVWARFVKNIVHILKSNKTLFSLPLPAICA